MNKLILSYKKDAYFTFSIECLKKNLSKQNLTMIDRLASCLFLLLHGDDVVVGRNTH